MLNKNVFFETCNSVSLISHVTELAKSIDNRLEVQRALATIGRTHFCHAEALTTNNRVLYDKALASSKLSYQKSLELCERYFPIHRLLIQNYKDLSAQFLGLKKQYLKEIICK